MGDNDEAAEVEGPCNSSNRASSQAHNCGGV